MQRAQGERGHQHQGSRQQRERSRRTDEPVEQRGEPGPDSQADDYRRLYGTERAAQQPDRYPALQQRHARDVEQHVAAPDDGEQHQHGGQRRLQGQQEQRQRPQQ